MFREEWFQHVLVGVLALAALLYLVISAVRGKHKNICSYCPPHNQGS